MDVFMHAVLSNHEHSRMTGQQCHYKHTGPYIMVCVHEKRYNTLFKRRCAEQSL